MADLTRDASLRFEGEITQREVVLDSSAAQTIYRGQPMILDISEDTIYARGYLDATVVAADDIFVGVALEGATVATTDTDTDTSKQKKIKIVTEPTIVGIKGTTFDASAQGDTMYMSDSSTLSATAADNPMIGKLVDVYDGYQFVRLSTPTVCTGA